MKIRAIVKKFAHYRVPMFLCNGQGYHSAEWFRHQIKDYRKLTNAMDLVRKSFMEMASDQKGT